MKLFFDLFPVILFFVSFKYAGNHPETALAWLNNLGLTSISGEQAPILLATVVVIAATLGQILWLKLRRKTVDKMLWASVVLIVIFGGLTLFFHNETFIKWKPTLLYLLFAASLFFSSLILKKNAIRAMMGKQLTLPDAIWQKLNTAWGLFFLSMAIINLWVAYRFDTATWVNFKLFGGMGLMLAFVIGQGLWLSRYLPENNAVDGEQKTPQ